MERGDYQNRNDSSVEDSLKRGQRHLETLKLILGKSIDDQTFRNQLLESNVIGSKDFLKWNRNSLGELFEGGPLLNPKRLDEAMRASKFMKRVLGFYAPFAYKFSNVRKSKVSHFFFFFPTID